jgi:hypothetical protein
MAIYKELSFYDFEEEFKRYNRENQFTRAGLIALYDYLSEELENDFPLDVIGLCCDFQEYKNFEEFKRNYTDQYKTFQELQDYHFVIPFETGFIVENF